MGTDTYLQSTKITLIYIFVYNIKTIGEHACQEPFTQFSILQRIDIIRHIKIVWCGFKKKVLTLNFYRINDYINLYIYIAMSMRIKCDTLKWAKQLIPIFFHGNSKINGINYML